MSELDIPSASVDHAGENAFDHVKPRQGINRSLFISQVAHVTALRPSSLSGKIQLGGSGLGQHSGHNQEGQQNPNAEEKETVESLPAQGLRRDETNPSAAYKQVLSIPKNWSLINEDAATLRTDKRAHTTIVGSGALNGPGDIEHAIDFHALSKTASKIP